MDAADAANETGESDEHPEVHPNSRLNSWVAITVALLATFLGIRDYSAGTSILTRSRSCSPS